jgi:hypothetical protein
LGSFLGRYRDHYCFRANASDGLIGLLAQCAAIQDLACYDSLLFLFIYGGPPPSPR